MFGVGVGGSYSIGEPPLTRSRAGRRRTRGCWADWPRSIQQMVQDCACEPTKNTIRAKHSKDGPGLLLNKTHNPGQACKKWFRIAFLSKENNPGQAFNRWSRIVSLSKENTIRAKHSKDGPGLSFWTKNKRNPGHFFTDYWPSPSQESVMYIYIYIYIYYIHTCIYIYIYIYTYM